MQDDDKPPEATRTGADLIGALQDIEPERYFSGEDMLSALLLAMVIDNCAGYSWEDEKTGLKSYLNAPHTTENDLDTYDNPTSADAIVALEEQGYIEVVHQEGPRIWAKVKPEGRALLERLSLEQKRNAASSWQAHTPR